MMKVILKNHHEEYAIREMINAFYPKMSIEFVTETDNSEDYIISEYSLKSNRHSYACYANINGQAFSFNLESEDFNKNKLKIVLYEVLKNATGINLPWGILTGIRPSKIVREYRENGGDEPDNYLVSEYYTSIEKASLAESVEKNEYRHIKSRYPDGLSLYVGIPFCPTRCLYCSFTSQSLAFSNKLTVPYVEALKKEIKQVSKMEYVNSKRIETVYFGGGTPSALSADQIDDILYCLFDNFDLRYIKEFTFEAGRPDTIDKQKLNVLLKYDIKRICINPQTLNDKTLVLIGRNHTSGDFFEKYHLARNMGFNHINCDVIAGLPDETDLDFKNTLSSLIQLNPESITLHTMSIKHGSYLDMNYDMYSLSASSTVNNMLNTAHQLLSGAGKIPYYMYRQKNMLGNLENVGYSNPGCECLYNIYIMEEVQPIVALGAGASTKIMSNNKIERVFNVKEVSEYIKRIDEMIERKQNLFETFNL